MTTGNITTEKHGHVLLMGLDRAAKYNAFDVALYRKLAIAYGELQRDPDLRCGLVFSHGRHTTAGVDLQEWAPWFAQGKWPDLPDGAIDPFGLKPDSPRIEKPIVMATQGICFTIGIELLLSTDVRVSAENTRFAQIEIKRGIYPVGGGTTRWIQESGWSNAMRYLLTGDEFDAHEAYRINLVQHVVPVGEQLSKALEIATTIAEQAPLGVYATLKSARLSREESEDAANARLLSDLIPIMQSEDAQEGVQSFIERRKANFKGR